MLYNDNEPHCPSVISLRAQPDTLRSLKPCPFCGDKTAELANTHSPSYWIECGTCGAEISDPKGKGVGGMRAHRASAFRAMAAWNTRDGERNG